MSTFSSPLFEITHAKLQEVLPHRLIIATVASGFIKRTFVATPAGFDPDFIIIDSGLIVAVPVSQSISASADFCKCCLE